MEKQELVGLLSSLANAVEQVLEKPTRSKGGTLFPLDDKEAEGLHDGLYGYVETPDGLRVRPYSVSDELHQRVQRDQFFSGEDVGYCPITGRYGI